MDRREFLEAIAGVTALVPGVSLLPALCQEPWARELHARARTLVAPRTLDAHQDATVTCIAELILPETDTVGATGVGVNRFIDLLLTEAMLESQRDRFLEGLTAIDRRSQALHGARFASVARQKQYALLQSLDRGPPIRDAAAAPEAAANEAVTAEGGFAMIKRLVVLGYFTSEPVARKLIHAPVIPGRYDGCIPV